MELIDCCKNLLLSRRSVYPKDFIHGAKISDETIEEMLALAVWAPTHKLTQPWHFKVFRNDGVKQFFEKQAEIYKAITPADKVSQGKLDKYAEKAGQVSHVIALIVKHDSGNRIPEIEEVVATACALQNIYLSLPAFGISGYLSTGDVCYTPQMADYLQLEAGDKCLGFFQLGVAKDGISQTNRKRTDSKLKTQWIGKIKG
ncbi:MAG: nitroreductase [Bacteroidota bacterium]|nr:MAG: nitroreductase [Bacteroidota bacterium]